MDPVERTQEVGLEFTDGMALPGSAGELVWEDTQAHLPAEYLLRRQSIPGVFVIHDNRAEFVALLDSVEGRPVPVTFPKQQLIVEKGRFRLQHGDEVAIK